MLRGFRVGPGEECLNRAEYRGSEDERRAADQNGGGEAGGARFGSTAVVMLSSISAIDELGTQLLQQAGAIRPGLSAGEIDVLPHGDGHCSSGGSKVVRLPDGKTGARTVLLSWVAKWVLARIPGVEGNPWVIQGRA